jgi:hypothetical protein
MKRSFTAATAFTGAVISDVSISRVGYVNSYCTSTPCSRAVKRTSRTCVAERIHARPWGIDAEMVLMSSFPMTVILVSGG